MRKLFTDFPIEGEFYLSPEDSRHVVRVLRHVTGDVRSEERRVGKEC